MASNTSLGPAEKGSKYWMQILVNKYSKKLSEVIRKNDSGIGNIKWLSPLKRNDYREPMLRSFPEFEGIDFTFWPQNQPWWDAVGVDEKGYILLVEAKAHTDEIKSSPCGATDENSLKLIKKSMENAHKVLTTSPEYGIENSHTYNETAWKENYYQLGNRLTFLVHLRDQKINKKSNARLILLNFVNDSGHISTSKEEFEKHYEKAFELLLGTSKCPSYVEIMYLDVKDIDSFAKRLLRKLAKFFVKSSV